MRTYSSVPFSDVTITGPFWHERLETVLTRTIPSQLKMLEKWDIRGVDQAAQAGAAADPAARPQRLHRPGLLGQRHRQVDRGCVLRPQPSPGRGGRARDRGR